MSITDIINQVGLEHIKVQPLHASLTRMKKLKKDTELTFATSHEMGESVTRESTGVESTHLGLVLWIPRDKLAPTISS